MQRNPLCRRRGGVASANPLPPPGCIYAQRPRVQWIDDSRFSPAVSRWGSRAKEADMQFHPVVILLGSPLLVCVAFLVFLPYFTKPEEFYIKRFRPGAAHQFTQAQLLFRAFVGIGFLYTGTFAAALHSRFQYRGEGSVGVVLAYNYIWRRASIGRCLLHLFQELEIPQVRRGRVRGKAPGQIPRPATLEDS